MSRLESIKDSIKSSVFILGSSIICFVALRNTLTWHFQRFWGASGLIAYTVAFYWLLSLFFMFLDLFNAPRFLMKYKMQPGKNEPANKKDLLKTGMVVFFNQLLSFPVMYGYSKLLKWRGTRYEDELPLFQTVVIDFIFFIIFEEIGFYYIHRMFHSRHFYKRFHKLHHDWQAPVALAAIYAHPLEHLLANLFPMLIGPFIMGSHIATLFLWNTLVTFSTINAHCGFHFPFFPSPEAHDYHHLKFNNCFGMLGVLDRLHNTDNSFRKTSMYKRHMMMLTLTPAREVFPDEKPTL